MPLGRRGAGLTIEHIAKVHIRKEEVVARVFEQRGDHPGLVHIISAMESCTSYRTWLDKATGKVFLRPDTGKYLHYCSYFVNPEFGRVHLRVPTAAFAGASVARSAVSTVACPCDGARVCAQVMSSPY